MFLIFFSFLFLRFSLSSRSFAVKKNRILTDTIFSSLFLVGNWQLARGVIFLPVHLKPTGKTKKGRPLHTRFKI